MLAGVILLTGASLASALRATGSGLMDTTRMVRALGERRAAAAAAWRDEPEGEEDEVRGLRSLRPPEPAAAELVVRATHVEGPSQDWMDAEAAAEELEPSAAQGAMPREAAQTPPTEADDARGGAQEIAGVARADAGALTPQGRLREAVTDDPASCGSCRTPRSC